jgi:hypothetical protein
MPIYSFKNKETSEEFDIILKMSEREPFLAENPHLEQIITSAPQMVDAARLGRMKPDQGFRDVLKSMKQNKAYTGNKINDWS